MMDTSPFLCTQPRKEFYGLRHTRPARADRGEERSPIRLRREQVSLLDLHFFTYFIVYIFHGKWYNRTVSVKMVGKKQRK